jgi:hypothetical protein
MGMWATLRTKKRAFNKGYIGNAQYGRVEARF